MLIKNLEPTQVQRVVALIDEAMDLPCERRAAWHAELASREPLLSELVTELLQSMADDTLGMFGDGSGPDATGRPLAGSVRTLDPDPSMQNRMFGPWRVLRLLGQGGMGSVWLAERADGLFERQVALKLVHSHFFGGSLRERFARERSILAALEHPNIAGLLDAGIADDGQPYLAIEYVQGTSLTEHCDRERLPLDARIALMMQVLVAVQHAHRNLILHRDLKPANILVTPDGQVRLLDFGIAKLMTDGHAHETELTHISGRALTPEFASPEQVAGRPLSTASDVYSLGVVLYVLLCGQRPFRLPRASRFALEEAIESAQAIRPSQQELGEGLAAARASTPLKLARQLKGDLDTIVLKAIKKDPAERYETADELLRDLQRYLAGEPVQARPDSVTYRCKKFVVRNRVQVALGLVFSVVLLGAAAVSIWQGQLAREHARVAQREAQRAHTVERFLLDIFKANSVDQTDPLRARQTTARELLDVGAKQAAESLKDSPEAQDAVLQTLADMYTQMGLNDEAARLREQRVVVLQHTHGADDVRVADALLSFVDDIALTNERARAVPALAEAAKILDGVGDHDSERRAHLWVTTADLEQYFSLAEMRRYADLGVRATQARADDWSSSVLALQVSGKQHALSGRYDLAAADDRAALELVARHDADSNWGVVPQLQLAEVEWARLQLEDAENNLRAALATSARINGDDYCVTLQARSKLGNFLQATGRGEEGARLLAETRATIERQGSNATPDSSAESRLNRGMALRAEGQLEGAEAVFAAELAYRRTYFPDSLPLSRALLLHASVLTTLGRLDESDAELSEAASLWERGAVGTAEPATANEYRLERARLSLARADAPGAEAWLNGLAKPRDAQALPLQQTDVQKQLVLADVRSYQRRFAEAQALAHAALEQVRASPLRARFPRLEADAAQRYGQARAESSTGDVDCAELERAAQLRSAQDPAGSFWRQQAETALTACLHSPALARLGQ